MKGTLRYMKLTDCRDEKNQRDILFFARRVIIRGCRRFLSDFPDVTNNAVFAIQIILKADP